MHSTSSTPVSPLRMYRPIRRTSGIVPARPSSHPQPLRPLHDQRPTTNSPPLEVPLLCPPNVTRNLRVSFRPPYLTPHPLLSPPPNIALQPPPFFAPPPARACHQRTT